MLPKIIMFNSISVDASISNFDVDVPLHYEVAAKYRADAFLVGSNTAKTGLDLFMQTFPSENATDTKQEVDSSNVDLPYWIIPDSRGVLNGLLHVFLQSGYCKKVIILLSKKTPKAYVDYLKANNFDFLVAGDDHVDYRLALEEIYNLYGVKTILTDSGGTLCSILLENGLIDELHLVVAPFVVGKKNLNLFRSLNQPVLLKLIKHEALDDNHVLLAYKIKCIKISK